MAVIVSRGRAPRLGADPAAPALGSICAVYVRGIDRPHRRLNRALSIGRRLHRRGNTRLGLACDALIRVVFGADVPSRMELPDEVTFMHNGLGTVVDEHVVFEGPALVYQHVTLGYALKPNGGVPRIGSHVVIGAGAGVFGGVRIGDGAFIGAGAVVTSDVPDGHVVHPPAPTVTPPRGADARRFWPEPRL
jgi:serine O-acetyltransferase